MLSCKDEASLEAGHNQTTVTVYIPVIWKFLSSELAWLCRKFEASLAYAVRSCFKETKKSVYLLELFLKLILCVAIAETV